MEVPSLISFTPKSSKEFMTSLLLSETFDQYELMQGEITTFNTFTINGFLQKDFFIVGDDKPVDLSSPTHIGAREYSTWAEVKPIALHIIKGKRAPLQFKFTLRLATKETQLIEKQVEDTTSATSTPSLLLSIRFDGQQITCVSGTNHASFTIDKTWEHTWDRYVTQFLSEHFQEHSNLHAHV